MNSPEDRSGNWLPHLLSRALNIEVLFCSMSLNHVLTAVCITCATHSAFILLENEDNKILCMDMAVYYQYLKWLLCVEGFFFYTFNSFWKHVIHYCSIIPIIVPPASPLFAVYFHMSTKFHCQGRWSKQIPV
jgi:hypothetical protein